MANGPGKKPPLVAEKRDFTGAKSRRKKASIQTKSKPKAAKTKRKSGASKSRGGVFGWLLRAFGRCFS